jgi:predicted PurR-regulated permease PerM
MAGPSVVADEVKTDEGRPDQDLRNAPVDEATAEAEAPALGRPGPALNRRTPFYIGLTGALGVAVAVLIVRVVLDAGPVLTLIGLSLFLAIGLDPAVVWLTRHHLPRWAAVTVVMLAVLALVGLFVLAAAGPVTREIHQLSVNLPKWRHQVATGQGWLGHLARRFHLTHLSSKLSGKLVSTSTVGGVLGAGKVILSAFTATVVVIVLTVYFLATMPGVRRLFLHFVPQSRRVRTAALTDEVTSRVGGFVLGNLLTSIISGVLTTVWLAAWGVPYPLLLGLLVAILDLIPVVGSTIGGIIASGVALTQGVGVALATLVFYVAYRLFEDYLLTPRVMRHTVRVSPGITIIATLTGGVLLGLLGALIAIPVAAGIELLLDEVTFPALDKR